MAIVTTLLMHTLVSRFASQSDLRIFAKQLEVKRQNFLLLDSDSDRDMLFSVSELQLLLVSPLVFETDFLYKKGRKLGLPA